MEIYELTEVAFDYIGEVYGYFAFGHQDAQAFVQAVIERYDPDEDFKTEQVKHEFWNEKLVIKDGEDFTYTCLIKTSAYALGAFPVTWVEI